MGGPPKKKITSKKLLEQYIAAMIKDHKRRDKVEAPKPQPYKGDPEDLERFLRHLENMWVLEPHKSKKDITKIRFATNLLHRNTTDKHCDPVKWYKAYARVRYSTALPHLVLFIIFLISHVYYICDFLLSIYGH